MRSGKDSYLSADTTFKGNVTRMIVACRIIARRVTN